MPAPLLPTAVVGSYPQPDWLVDHSVLKSQTVPRVRLKRMWRVPEQFLEQAQDDATLIAKGLGGGTATLVEVELAREFK